MKGFIRVALVAFMVLAMTSGAYAADTIKIGALFSVTGPASFLGAPEANTLQMVVDQINAKGGIKGKKIEIVVKDTGGSSEKAVSFAKQLVEEEKVFAVIGPSTSGETMAIKKYMEDSKTLLMSCAAAEVIVNPVGKYVFKTPQKDSDAVKRIYEVAKSLGINKIAVLSSNTGFGKAGKEQLEKIAPEYGMQVVISEVYDKAATDLTPVATKIKDSGAQAVVNWSIEPAQSIVIKNLRQVDFKGRIFQSHGFGNIKYVEAAGAAAEGVIFPAGRLLVVDQLDKSDRQKPVLDKYKKDYEAKFKDSVSTFGGHAYDAMIILANAMEKAGTDKDKVREEIENTKLFVGTAGVFTFSPADHNGLGMTAFEMLTVKNGKFTFYAAPKAADAKAAAPKADAKKK